ncbi:methyltransferase [Dyella flagellata]|uniref:Methyltransferase/methylase n=1 Tax=Dyella flagellata TaxID=1867833 RepID=A0ABQ5XJU5_9GAMM|nr:methyltransferase [Dyella flagellata]GLQ90780.1 methyltransferase/methylase [Dyella flagellata]
MQHTQNASHTAPVNDSTGTTELTPDRLLQLGMGFWASRTMLSAVDLGVFTHLVGGGTAKQLEEAIGLHSRSSRDFLDALVALGALERDGETYRNTPDADLFLDKAKPSYVGGLLEMMSSRLYAHWGSLTEALRTGEPMNAAKHEGSPFDELYRDEASLRSFLQAMTGVSLGAAKAIAEKFPWKDYRTFIDIGAAQGACPVQIALAHPHLSGGGFDLPMVAPVFEDYVASYGLEDRLRFYPGDFFNDPCPTADVLIMGHILHDWDLEQKKALLAKCHKALPPGGCLIVYDAIIDDDRKKNAFGLLMSLNMLIETPGGFDYTGADCCQWMKNAGFRDMRVEPLLGPDSMVIGVK